MPLPRILAHLFLCLALLAGGFAPDVVASDSAALSAPCHDLAGELVEPPPTDCCDDGACACDCLHPVSSGFQVAAPLSRLPLRARDERDSATALPCTSAAPEFRPPIA